MWVFNLQDGFQCSAQLLDFSCKLSHQLLFVRLFGHIGKFLFKYIEDKSTMRRTVTIVNQLLKFTWLQITYVFVVYCCLYILTADKA